MGTLSVAPRVGVVPGRLNFPCPVTRRRLELVGPVDAIAWDLFGKVTSYAQYAIELPFASVFRAMTEAPSMATIATLIIHWQLIAYFWRKSTHSLRTRELVA